MSKALTLSVSRSGSLWVSFTAISSSSDLSKKHTMYFDQDRTKKLNDGIKMNIVNAAIR